MPNLFVRPRGHRYASNSTDSLENCLPAGAARTDELPRPHRNDRPVEWTFEPFSPSKYEKFLSQIIFITPRRWTRPSSSETFGISNGALSSAKNRRSSLNLLAEKGRKKRKKKEERREKSSTFLLQSPPSLFVFLFTSLPSVPGNV